MRIRIKNVYGNIDKGNKLNYFLFPDFTQYMGDMEVQDFKALTGVTDRWVKKSNIANINAKKKQI